MKKIFALILFASLLASCNKDYFDEGSPTGAAPDDDIFATVGNAGTVMSGIYRYLYSRFDNQNTPGHGGVMLQLDFMCEDLHQATANWYSPANGTGNWVGHKNASYAYVNYPFRLYYRCIGNANAIIKYIDAASGTPADKNRTKGEALAMRAWSYFNLVQIFAKRYVAGGNNSQLGVSMPLSPDDLKLPRSTVEEVYTQIDKDLADAITAFGAGSASPSGPQSKSHLNVRSAWAIRAKVALVKQDYVNAAAYAQQVITLGGHSLMSNAQYQAGFNDLSNPEWIWGCFVQDDQGDTFGSYFGQISWDGNTTYVRGTPKRINSALYNQITNTDVRKKMWEPNPTSANFPLPASNYSHSPYMSRKFKIRTLPTIGDVPYIRLAEMYLILAEAYARTPGKEAEARQALYTLAVNRDPSYVLSVNTGAALINEILTQRRIEFWGEGLRWFDLKRLNLPMDRSVVPNYVSASGGGTITVPAGGNIWEFAIPIAEINANPNSVQNP